MKHTLAVLFFVAVFALAFPGSAEDAALYTFQNGVVFGMSQEAVRRTLLENAGIDESAWMTRENDKWVTMSHSFMGKKGDYSVILSYLFDQDQMRIARYEFQEGFRFDAGKAADTYDTVTRSLNAVYGASEEPAPRELLWLMSAMLPNASSGAYQDSDFSNARVWRMENESLYQFHYASGINTNFILIYTNLSGVSGGAASSLVFGHYEQDGDRANGAEPIEWIVLKEDGGKALLISRYILDTPVYYPSRADVTWEDSYLRAWLNDIFLNKAFTADEQTRILLTDVDNSQRQCCDIWSTNGGNDTQDRIFVLSFAEAFGVDDRYFASDAERISAPTDYALQRGASTQNTFKSGHYEADGRPSGSWWLRSPGTYQSNAAIVSNDGDLFNTYVNNGHLGVRPVLWIDLASQASESENTP